MDELQVKTYSLSNELRLKHTDYQIQINEFMKMCTFNYNFTLSIFKIAGRIF